MTDFAKVRAILDAATPGPWWVFDEPAETRGVYGPDGDEIAKVQGNLALGGDALDNARAIVVARNLAPELLAVAEAARAVADGWRDYVEAQAGRGHIGQVHTSESVLEGGCGRCAGAQYGTEVAMNEYVVPVLRAALDALHAKMKWQVTPSGHVHKGKWCEMCVQHGIDIEHEATRD